MQLLTTLVEQNNQILTWIRSQNETDEIKRKQEPIKLPVQLPICDENELSTLEEYLNNDVNFGEMIDPRTILKGEAGVWWLGVKNDVTSWSDFEIRLRENFAPVREAYLIFIDITQEKQLPGISTEEFIRRKRLLFSQLPKSQSETNQLDMVFGLLRLEIREKVTRAEVKNFKDLLKAAQAAEHVLKEKDRVVSTETNEYKPLPGSRPAPTRKTRCRYCKNYGHTVETCKKLSSRMDNSQKGVKPNRVEEITQFPSASVPKFRCYGCGTPGVVRSNCSTCNANKAQRPAVDIGCCSIAVSTDSRDRPVVYIDIGGVATPTTE
ncbi:activity-regulated cytoskeleton associated protein 1-like isoform X2 [Choristoneura fumiferana]